MNTAAKSIRKYDLFSLLDFFEKVSQNVFFSVLRILYLTKPTTLISNLIMKSFDGQNYRWSDDFLENCKLSGFSPEMTFDIRISSSDPIIVPPPPNKFKVFRVTVKLVTFKRDF